MRISVSILTPNAFSIRRAISPERLTRPFSRPDSAGRETRTRGGGSGHREARGLDDLGADKVAWVGRILDWHSSDWLVSSGSLLDSSRKCGIGGDALRIILFIQPLETFVGEISNVHRRLGSRRP